MTGLPDDLTDIDADENCRPSGVPGGVLKVASLPHAGRVDGLTRLTRFSSPPIIRTLLYRFAQPAALVSRDHARDDAGRLGRPASAETSADIALLSRINRSEICASVHRWPAMASVTSNMSAERASRVA